MSWVEKYHWIFSNLKCLTVASVINNNIDNDLWKMRGLESESWSSIGWELCWSSKVRIGSKKNYIAVFWTSDGTNKRDSNETDKESNYIPENGNGKLNDVPIFALLKENIFVDYFVWIQSFGELAWLIFPNEKNKNQICYAITKVFEKVLVHLLVSVFLFENNIANKIWRFINKKEPTFFLVSFTWSPD